MTFNEFLPIVSLILIGYLCVSSITNRICKCVENKALADSYTALIKEGRLPAKEDNAEEKES